MKKQILLTSVVALFGVYTSKAQDELDLSRDSVITTEVVNHSKYTVETNTFGHDWFIGLGVGGNMYFGDHDKQMDFLDRPHLYGEVYFGKWFTPGICARIQVSGGRSRGLSGWTAHNEANGMDNVGNYLGYIMYDQNNQPIVYEKAKSVGYLMYKTQEDWMNVGADVMFNLSNMLLGYKEDRVYSFIPYAGVGFAFSLNNYHPYKAPVAGGRVTKQPDPQKSRTISASLGFLNKFRLSSHWDFNVDIRGIYVGDNFDGEFGGIRNGFYLNQIGGSIGEGILTATIGLAYNINTGWKKSVSTTIRVNENLLQDLNSRLAQSQKDNEALRAQLEDALNRQVNQENITAQPLLITFPIDRWTLSKKDRVNLGFLAEAIKANPNMTYVVTGYADKGTGSVKRNVFLSQKRADVVYDCLVNEFGVSESQLRKTSEGGVGNMYYNDPRLSRAVLTKVVTE